MLECAPDFCPAPTAKSQLDRVIAVVVTWCSFQQDFQDTAKVMKLGDAMAANQRPQSACAEPLDNDQLRPVDQRW